MVVTCTKANSNLLKWCRTQGGRSVQDAAKRLNLELQAYNALETVESHPTLGQLRKLAEFYKLPVGIFFLPAPPENLKQPKDFRGQNGEASPKLLRSIRRARFVQKHLKQFVENSTSSLWSPVTDLERNTNLARTWLGLTDTEQTKNRDVNRFYKHLVSLLEKHGIYVLQHSFPSEEAKAYCLAESPKIIVVSTGDQYMGSRIFSLIHELCHLSQGQSGLCLPLSGNSSYSKERSCERFAAEFLMPPRLIKPLVQGMDKEMLTDDDFLRSTAEILKTSMYSLLIRLKELDYINQSDVNIKKRAWGKIPHRKTGFATTSRAQKVLKENGQAYTQAVMQAYNNNQISDFDASYLLNINQGYLNEVGEKVAVA